MSGLLEKREGGFANTEEAAEFLVKGRSGYLGGIPELLNQLWHADLSAFVRVLPPDDARVLSLTTASCRELQGLRCRIAGELFA